MCETYVHMYAQDFLCSLFGFCIGCVQTPDWPTLCVCCCPLFFSLMFCFTRFYWAEWVLMGWVSTLCVLGGVCGHHVECCTSCPYIKRSSFSCSGQKQTPGGTSKTHKHQQQFTGSSTCRGKQPEPTAASSWPGTHSSFLSFELLRWKFSHYITDNNTATNLPLHLLTRVICFLSFPKNEALREAFLLELCDVFYCQVPDLVNANSPITPALPVLVAEVTNTGSGTTGASGLGFKARTSSRSSPKTGSRIQNASKPGVARSAVVDGMVMAKQNQSKEQAEKKNQAINQLRKLLVEGNKRVEALATVIQHLFNEVPQLCLCFPNSEKNTTPPAVGWKLLSLPTVFLNCIKNMKANKCFTIYILVVNIE